MRGLGVEVREVRVRGVALGLAEIETLGVAVVCSTVSGVADLLPKYTTAATSNATNKM